MGNEGINSEKLLESIATEEKGANKKSSGRKPGKFINDLKAEVEALKNDLREKIFTAGSLTEKLQATYNMQEFINSQGNKPTPGLEILGSFNAPDILDTVAKEHVKPGNFYHWSNSHPIIHDVRKGRGFKDVLNNKGEPVTMGDTVLMTMPEKQYDAEIVQPKQRRKTAVRKAIVENYKEAGRELGMEVYGKIQYDDGEVVHAGDNNE